MNAQPDGIRAALYARVSTSNGQKPDMQLAELRSYCERRGWAVFAEYVDAGICSCDYAPVGSAIANCSSIGRRSSS
jgi:hypothetical protein